MTSTTNNKVQAIQSYCYFRCSRNESKRKVELLILDSIPLYVCVCVCLFCLVCYCVRGRWFRWYGIVEKLLLVLRRSKSNIYMFSTASNIFWVRMSEALTNETKRNELKGRKKEIKTKSNYYWAIIINYNILTII